MSTIYGTSTSAFYERSLMDLTALRKQAEETQAEAPAEVEVEVVEAPVADAAETTEG